MKIKNLSVHSIFGELFVDEFVVIDNHVIARMGPGGTVNRCWKPEELLRAFPALQQPHRPLNTFATNELVLSVGHSEQVPLESITGRAVVMPYVDVLTHEQSPNTQWWFYRQAVDDHRLEPDLVADVMNEETGNFEVENPTMKIKICKLCHLKISTREKRSIVGSVDETIEWICGNCASDSSQPPLLAGKEWLQSLTLDAITQPQESRRRVIVDKFFNSIVSGLGEGHSNMILDSPEILKAFSIELETEIFVSTEERPRDYKSRVFTLNFNLCDRKNTSIRRRILAGEFSPKTLAQADSETMASDEVRAQRKQQRDKYFSTQVVKVVVVPEMEQQETGPAKKVRIREEVIKSSEDEMVMDEVEVPSFAPPPVPVETHVEETGGIDGGDEELISDPDEEKQIIDHGSANKVDLVEDTNAKKHVDVNAAVAVLNEYAESIKSRLNRLNYDSLKTHSLLFVEYLIRHTGK